MIVAPEVDRMRPDISIIIPVHNRPAQLNYLVQRFRRLIREAGAAASVELIVVDDGSDLALQLERPSEAILLRNGARMGAPKARQRGFAQASGRYVHFHDSDDDVSDDWLMGVLQLISEATFDLLFTPRLVRTRDGEKGKHQEPKALQRLLHAPLALRSYLSYENCIGPLGSVTFSRRAAERMSFPALASCQDWHMYWEALQEDSVLVYRPNIWHVYNRFDGDRISSSVDRKRSGMEAAAKLMCQSERKRRLVHYFLNLGYDLKMRHRRGVLPRTFYGALRPAMLELARRPVLDRLLFGPGLSS